MRGSNNTSVSEILGRGTVHPFPARMAPGIALNAVKGQRPLRILDPMSGSGTVLAVAQANGHQAIGIDMDPLAVMISKVWTTPVNRKPIKLCAEDVLERARRRFKLLPVGDAYPPNSDEETRRFVRYWFDSYVRRQLAALSSSIEEVQDETKRNVLWCAFSRLIIAKKVGVSLAMDLSHSRPHRVFSRAPTKPFRSFLSSVDRVVKNCIDIERDDVDNTPHVYRGDARKLLLEDHSIDLVLTSPPYLNAIDYIRCSKFSLVWMGYGVKDSRAIRKTIIGAEAATDSHDKDEIQEIISRLGLNPKLRRKEERILARYIDDMQRTVSEAHRVLTNSGRAVYVVGENTIRGTFIPNAEIVKMLAHAVGLHHVETRTRELPANRRYLPPPTTQSEAAPLGTRMRLESVLTFEKMA